MDVVVVGGGIIGLSTAWRLRQSGLKVSVWDAGAIGGESSWAGAGMLAPGGEFEYRSHWSEFALASAKLYPDYIQELQTESGERIDYRRCGALETAGSEAGWRALTLRADRQRQWGVTVEITPETAGPRTLFYPDDAAVDPRNLVHALRLTCERAGVAFHEGQAVRQVVAEQGHITEPEPAAAAVVAAGAWSTTFAVRVNGGNIPLEPAVPVRGHLVSFPASTATPGPILRQEHTYLLERSNGVVIAGSTTERVGFRRKPDLDLFADIERRAAMLLPRLAQLTPLARWIGFRPGTQSGEPQMGQLGNSPVYLAYGHYRNGILMAPRTAALLTRVINAS